MGDEQMTLLELMKTNGRIGLADISIRGAMSTGIPVGDHIVREYVEVINLPLHVRDDVAADGSPAIGSSAMTKEYTTILPETLTEIYVVCFGDRPCYKVTNPSDDFINDMREHRMVSLSEAKGRY
jgi:hypothetical protein